MDNMTLDKVFNLVFGRYDKLHLLSMDDIDVDFNVWPSFAVLGSLLSSEELPRTLWIGPKQSTMDRLLTQLRVNILGEDAIALPRSCFGTIHYHRPNICRELDTKCSKMLRAKRYIANGVVSMFKQWNCSDTGIVIVEDYSLDHTILDVSSLEELLVKADLAA